MIENLLANSRARTKRTLASFNPEKLRALGKRTGPLTKEPCLDWITEICLCGDGKQYSLRDIVDLAQKCMLKRDFAVLPLRVKSHSIHHSNAIFNLFYRCHL